MRKVLLSFHASVLSKHDSDPRQHKDYSLHPDTWEEAVDEGLGLKYQIFEGLSPARHGSEGVRSRKPRPPTAHQLAVEIKTAMDVLSTF